MVRCARALLLLLFFSPALQLKGQVAPADIDAKIKILDSLNTHNRRYDLVKILKELDSLAQKKVLSPMQSLLYHYHYSNFYFDDSNLKKAEYHGLKADSLANLVTLKPKRKAALMAALGNLYQVKGDFSLAEEYLLKSAEEAKIDGDSSRYYATLVNLAINGEESGNIELAMNRYVLARRYAEKVDLKYMLAIIENNVGEIYRKHYRDFKSAEKYYLKAITLNEENADTINLAMNYNNLGIIYSELERYDEAKEVYRKSIRLKESMGNIAGQASALHGLGDIEMKLKNYDQAEAYFAQSLELSRRYNIDIGVYYCQISLSEVLLAQKDFVNALKMAQAAANWAKSSQSKEFIATAYLYLAKAHEALGNYQSSLEYLKIAYENKDSLESARYQKEAIAIRTEYENELAISENERLKVIELEKNEKIAFQRTLITITISSIAIFIVLGFFLIRTLKQRKEALHRYQEMNRKVAANNQQLVEKEQELSATNAMKSRILSVLGHDLRSPLASLSGLLSISSAEEIKRDELKTLLQSLKKETDNSLATLENILFWAQAQLDDSGINKGPVEVAPLIEEISKTYDHGARHKKLTIKLASNQKKTVLADQNMLRSMLGNLISNAIKFSKQGGQITIECYSTEGGERTRFCVKDEGEGMDLEVMKKLNQSLKVKSEAGTSGEKGMGVGLQIVSDFAKMHGGLLKFYPNEPKGTVACLELPQ